jgi:serine/threonine protein kinase
MKRLRTNVSDTDAGERYYLVGRLGVGGMGTIVEAIDIRGGGRVALKFARVGRGDRRPAIRQLVAEAAAMTLARGVHTCRVLEVTTYQNRPCLVMERLVGGTLETWLSRGRLPIDVVVDVGLQLTEALTAVHRAGLVHHDIKPANVFVTSRRRVKLLDFGLAVPAGSPADVQSRECRSSVFGTAKYIAPERILRWPADPRSDLFSLGAVLYELVTGRKPFTGESASEVIFNVLDTRPPSVCGLAGECPVALDRLIHRLLAKRVARRFQSSEEVGQALRDVRRSRARLVKRQIAWGGKGWPVPPCRLRLDDHATLDPGHEACGI